MSARGPYPTLAIVLGPEPGQSDTLLGMKSQEQQRRRPGLNLSTGTRVGPDPPMETGPHVGKSRSQGARSKRVDSQLYQTKQLLHAM